MVTESVNLNFLEELSVLDLYAGTNIPTPDFESFFGDSIEIFNLTRESRTISIDTPEIPIARIPGLTFDLSFDIEIGDFETGLELDVDNPTLGDVGIFYPVSTTLDLPSFVDTPGTTFEISTGDDFFSSSPFLTGQAIDFGVFGLDFILGLDSYQISNISINPSIFNISLPSISLGDIELISEPINETYRLFTVGSATGGLLSELNLEGAGLFNIELGFPEGETDLDRGQLRSPSGVLEPLSVEVDSSAFSFSGDLVDLVLTVATLGGSRLLRPVEDILDAFQFTTEIPRVGEVGFGFNPFEINLDSSLTTTQSFEFDPGDITATVEFLTDGVEGDSEPKPLGESFTFTAPDNLEEPIVGQVVYNLSSQITLDYLLRRNVTGSIQLGGIDVELPGSLGLTVLDGIDGGSLSLDVPLDLPLEVTFDVPLQFTQPFQISTDRNEESSIIDVPPITPPPIDTPNIITGTPDSDSLTGIDEDDIITGGRGQDTLTGGGGGDQFVYTSIVEAGDTITDFEVGVDQIVLTEVLDSFGYQGSDPIADEFIQFALQDSRSFVQLDPDGAVGSGASRFFILVENVAVTDLENPSNFVF